MHNLAVHGIGDRFRLFPARRRARFRGSIESRPRFTLRGTVRCTHALAAPKVHPG